MWPVHYERKVIGEGSRVEDGTIKVCPHELIVRVREDENVRDRVQVQGVVVLPIQWSCLELHWTQVALIQHSLDY